MTAPQPVFVESQLVDGPAATSALADLGLRPELFVAAMLRGHEMQQRCLPVHPKTFPGQVMWAETVAELRTRFFDLNQGWQAGQAGNYETTYHPGRRIAIAVVGGDANTGVRGLQPPKTARRRGPVTARRVSHNAAGQLTLDLPDLAVPADDDSQCATWFFLLKARDGVLYSELSLPLLLGEDHRVARWGRRILLRETTLVGAVTPTEPDEDGDDAPNVRVTRR